VSDQYLPKSDQPSSWSGDYRSPPISRQQNSLNVPGLTWNSSEPVTPIQPLNRPVCYACHQNLGTLQGSNISTPVMAVEKKHHQHSSPSVKPSGLQGVYGPPCPHQQSLVKLERANTWDTSQPGTMKEMKLDKFTCQSIKTDKFDLQAADRVQERHQVSISLIFYIQLFVPKCFQSF